MRADTSSDKVFKIRLKFKFLAQKELEICLFQSLSKVSYQILGIFKAYANSYELFCDASFDEFFAA